MLKTISFVVLFLVSSKTFAAKAVDPKYVPKTQCLVRVTEGLRWKACAYEYPNTSFKVLYYFNGLTGSQLTWRDSAFEKEIIKHWIDSGEKPPIVVSLSFETPILHKMIWFMVEKNSSYLSGKFELVTRTILPLIQQKFLSRISVQENLLMGVSMGAFNASQLYFKYPIFTKTALICLPASIVTPFDQPPLVENFIARTQADKKVVNFANGVARDYMPTIEDWNRHSPLNMAFNNLTSQSLPLYLANGTGDIFGFDEGDRIMARYGAAVGAPVTSRFYARRPHCGVDAKPIADFFTGVGESPRAADEIDIFPPVAAEAMTWFGR